MYIGSNLALSAGDLVTAQEAKAMLEHTVAEIKKIRLQLLMQ